MKRLTYLCCTLILLMGPYIRLKANDQKYVLALNERYSWRVDLLPCLDCNEARRFLGFDRNYVMYVFIESSLYVLPPDGSQPDTFDLSETWAKYIDDMIPFEDGTVLFLTTPALGPGLRSGRQLFIYDLNKHSGTLFEDGFGNMWDCRNFLFNGTFIERIGPDKKIILCDRDQISVMNLSIETFENHIDYLFSPESGFLWTRLQGGSDGKMYFISSCFLDPGVTCSVLATIRRYDPQSELWSTLLLPDDVIDLTDKSYGEVRSLGVDSEGSIYIYMYNNAKPYMTKFDSMNNVVWQFRDEDLPEGRMALLDKDLFVDIETGHLLQSMPMPASATPR